MPKLQMKINKIFLLHPVIRLTGKSRSCSKLCLVVAVKTNRGNYKLWTAWERGREANYHANNNPLIPLQTLHRRNAFKLDFNSLCCPRRECSVSVIYSCKSFNRLITTRRSIIYLFSGFSHKEVNFQPRLSFRWKWLARVVCQLAVNTFLKWFDGIAPVTSLKNILNWWLCVKLDYLLHDDTCLTQIMF